MKSMNTIKCYNIFTIPLFSAVIGLGLIFVIYFKKNVSTIFSQQILDNKLLLILNRTTTIITFFICQKRLLYTSWALPTSLAFLFLFFFFFFFFNLLPFEPIFPLLGQLWDHPHLHVLVSILGFYWAGHFLFFVLYCCRRFDVLASLP